jgi:hypothetical protein
MDTHTHTHTQLDLDLDTHTQLARAKVRDLESIKVRDNLKDAANFGTSLRLMTPRSYIVSLKLRSLNAWYRKEARRLGITLKDIERY